MLGLIKPDKGYVEIYGRVSIFIELNTGINRLLNSRGNYTDLVWREMCRLIVIDFTLKTYKRYLKAIKGAYQNIFRFDEFLSLSEYPDIFIIIRHDVDRLPERALKMAKLEADMDIRSSFFFRTKPHVLKPDIIRAIAQNGHEIGYHYESLSDANGDFVQALKDFETNLNRLRQIVPIKTIAMHGNPLSAYDNRILWKHFENSFDLKTRFSISGEVYLDINYEDIAYISDTGRNWRTGKSNQRDYVNSSIHPEFTAGKDLLNCLKSIDYPKIVFQIHPERWTDSLAAYCTQWSKDMFINFMKFAIGLIRKKSGS